MRIGKVYIRNGRYFIKIGNKLVRRSHVVWNKYHPNDLVKIGEVVHHINKDMLDDRIENLQKMGNFEHHQIHSKTSTEALNRWRKKNIEKAKKQGSLAIKLLQQRMKIDPVFAAWVWERRKSGIDKAAKSRTGKKRNIEFRIAHSKRMKALWNDPKTKQNILDKRKAAKKKREAIL